MELRRIVSRMLLWAGLLASAIPATTAILCKAEARAEDVALANDDEGDKLFGDSADGHGDDSLCGAACCCEERCVLPVFESELLFFKYHRADGARVGDTAGFEDAPTEYATASRVTLGAALVDGPGVRVRWFNYDHTFAANEQGISRLAVDIYNFDGEVFDVIQLGPDWDVELSGGVRYSNFVEEMWDGPTQAVLERRINFLSSWGGLVGAEFRRRFWMGSLFVRARGGVHLADSHIRNQDPATRNGPFFSQFVDLRDTTTATTELALGYEASYQTDLGARLFFRTGYEWQSWFNYSSNFDAGAAPQSESFFTGRSDVAFHGFTASIGISR